MLTVNIFYVSQQARFTLWARKDKEIDLRVKLPYCTGGMVTYFF